MNKYINPEFEVVYLPQEDVVRTSEDVKDDIDW